MVVTKLKPVFEEAIIAAIKRAKDVKELHETLGSLIMETRITRNHDAIAMAWIEKNEEFRISNSTAVPDSVMAQKTTSTNKKTRSHPRRQGHGARSVPFSLSHPDAGRLGD